MNNPGNRVHPTNLAEWSFYYGDFDSLEACQYYIKAHEGEVVLEKVENVGRPFSYHCLYWPKGSLGIPGTGKEERLPRAAKYAALFIWLYNQGIPTADADVICCEMNL